MKIDVGVLPENIEPHVPETENGGILEHVGSVQVEEYGSDHDHLVAVGTPALVHLLHEDQLVQALAEERLDGSADMTVDLIAEGGVHLKRG